MDINIKNTKRDLYALRECKRWLGYAGARDDAGLTDRCVMRWFGVSQAVIDDWHHYGAPVPVHIALRFARSLRKDKAHWTAQVYCKANQTS